MDLVKQLSAACTTRKTIWKHLGYELELSQNDLALIEDKFSDSVNRCSAMLEFWLEKQVDATWETLREALVLVELEQLANTISQQLSENTSSPTSETKSNTNQIVCVCVCVLRVCVCVCVCVCACMCM